MSLKLIGVSARGAANFLDELKERIRRGELKTWSIHIDHFTHTDRKWAKQGYFHFPEMVRPKCNYFELAFKWPNDMPGDPLNVYVYYHCQFIQILLSTQFNARLLDIAVSPDYSLFEPETKKS